jgi:hypothetical protein
MATKINCLAIDCIFNEAERCTLAEIIYDPAEGCLTYEATEEDVSDLDEAEEEDLLLGDENEGLDEDEELDEDTAKGD